MSDQPNDELVAEFKEACEQVIEDAEYATREDVMAVLAKELDEQRPIPAEYFSKAKHSDSVSELLGKVEVDEEQRIEDEASRLLDRLEEHGVPEDLLDAVNEHLDARAVSKELGVDYVDSYLAGQLENGGEVLSAQREKAQKQQDVVAEAVADAATEAKVLDHTVYADEEGV